jgi:hypothetical protein
MHALFPKTDERGMWGRISYALSFLVFLCSVSNIMYCRLKTDPKCQLQSVSLFFSTYHMLSHLFVPVYILVLNFPFR